MCQLCHAHLSFFSLYSSCSSFCHRPSMIGSGTAPQPICRRVVGQSCKRASATQHGTAATAVTALGTIGEGCLPSAIALAFASILDRRSAVSTLISSHTRLSAARGCGPMATRARSKLTACTEATNNSRHSAAGKGKHTSSCCCLRCLVGATSRSRSGSIMELKWFTVSSYNGPLGGPAD